MSKPKEDANDTPSPDLVLYEKVNSSRVIDLLRSDLINDGDVRVLLDYAENGGNLKVDYFKSDKNHALSSKTGLQRLYANTRGYLCQDNCLDIDFINCCPTILLDEIKKLDPDQTGIPSLTKYVDHRDDFLELVKPYGIDKRYILAIINGANVPNLSNHDNITRMLREMQSVADRVFSITGDKLYLQKRQAEYLNNLHQGLLAYDYKIVALINDGIIVKRKSNIDELISEWNNNSECPVKITVKPWPETKIKKRKEFNWKDPTFFIDLNRDKFYSSARQALVDNIRNMVKTIVVTADWKLAVIKKTIRSDHGYERKFDMIKTRDIGVQYNIKDEDGEMKKPISLISLMKMVPSLFTVSHVSCFESNDPNCFSLFRGFITQFTERPKGDLSEYIKPIRDHIKVVWCNNNDSHFKWLENWFAFIIQKCPKKTNSIVQITGDEGTGKSCVFEWLVEKVFGELCIILSGCDKLTRNFNAHLLGKVLVCLEEVSGDKHDLHRIKHLATGTFIDIERKGIDVETDVNGINIICFSNLDNPMPPIPGINRRLVHMRSNPIYMKDKEYFKKLIDFLENDKVSPIAFYHYYREFELDTNCLFNEKPVTEEKNYNRFMTLPEVDRAVYYTITKNNDEAVEKTAQEITDVCKSLYKDSKTSAVGTGRRLTNLGFDKKCKDGYYRYIIDKDKFHKFDEDLAELCREFCKDDTCIDFDNLIKK
jgi:hypothetical protein